MTKRWRYTFALLAAVLLWAASPALRAQEDVVPPATGGFDVDPGSAIPVEPEPPVVRPSEPLTPDVPSLSPEPSKPLPESSNVETYGGVSDESEAEPEETVKTTEVPSAPGTGKVPSEYQIQAGDTLWDICQKLLDNPWYWPKLWALNDYILNPHLIYPGNRLAFFSGSVTAPPKLEIVDENTAKPLTTTEAPTIKEAEETPAVTEAPVGTGPEGIAFVGKKKVQVNLKTLSFITEKEIATAGEITHSGEPKMELYTGDRVYLAFSKRRKVSVGDKFHVITKVKNVKDPDAIFGSIGVLVKKKAVIKVLAIHKKTVEGIIIDCEDGSRRGDRIIPYVSPIRTLVSHKLDRDIRAKIAEGENQQTLISNNDFIFLNAGKKQGLEDGAMLQVVRRGDGIFAGDDENLPDVPVGYLLVVETGAETATAYVTSVRDSLRVGDRVQSRLED